MEYREGEEGRWEGRGCQGGVGKKLYIRGDWWGEGAAEGWSSVLSGGRVVHGRFKIGLGG